MEPLVSVVMPAYNAGKYIAESVTSMLKQSYQNWELLITNDGSTDNTLDILSSFKDNRIKIFTQQNKGVSAARNTALSHMQGKYFTFLDADDLLPSDSLSLRIRFSELHPEIDIVGGSVRFFNSQGVQRVWKPQYKGDPLQPFIRIDERAFCNPSLFIRKKDGIQYFFKQGMSHVEDLLFFATISSQVPHNYDYITDLIYEYRVSDNSAMSNLVGLENGYWTFYESIKSFPNALPANIKYLKWRIIRIMTLSYLAVGKVGNAIKVMPKILSK
jgi:glycosyltransferase involved in cell wall biosynthesis